MVVITQILTTPGVKLVGPLPPEIQSYVTFTAGISANWGSFSKHAENNARVLVHKSDIHSKRQTLSVSPNPSLALQYKAA
jgi:hypothetical protein